MLFPGEVVPIRVRYVSHFGVLTRLMGTGILSFLCFFFLVGVVAVFCVLYCWVAVGLCVVFAVLLCWFDSIPSGSFIFTQKL